MTNQKQKLTKEILQIKFKKLFLNRFYFIFNKKRMLCERATELGLKTCMLRERATELGLNTGMLRVLKVRVRTIRSK